MTTSQFNFPPSGGIECVDEPKKYFGFKFSKAFCDLTPSMKRKKMREFSLFILSECSKLKRVI